MSRRGKATVQTAPQSTPPSKVSAGKAVRPASNATVKKARKNSKVTRKQPAATSTGAAGGNPIENYRQELLRRAMRGLRYDSGLVEIDTKEAAQIARRGSVEQAMAEAERAEQALTDRNDSLGAIAGFTKAVIIAPQLARPYEGLGRALITKGKVQEAEAAFRTALTIDPNLVEAHFNLGHVLQMQGRLEEAISAWHEVLKRKPGDGETHSRLAIAYYYLNDYLNAWRHVHAAEASNHAVPPQFRELLAARMAEPPRETER